MPMGIYPRKSLLERFGAKINKGEPDECWLWVGARNPSGYGKIKAHGGFLAAHRVAFALAHGPILPGMCVCHSCDNPPCCNPAHLFLGTNKDNTLDAIAKGRIAIGRRCGAYTHPENRPRGSSHGNAKLNEALVVAIRRDGLAGISRKAIAEKYQICQSNVSLILLGKAWGHVALEKSASMGAK